MLITAAALAMALTVTASPTSDLERSVAMMAKIGSAYAPSFSPDAQQVAFLTNISVVMAGVTGFPDLFAAGANLFGVVNFETFFEHSEPWMAAISTIEYGDPATQGDMLRELSPIHKVDRIRTPLIVLHGANDTNVPVIEAEQVVESLRKRNVEVEYILFPDEGHGWRKTPNRIRSAGAITQFFQRTLSP